MLASCFIPQHYQDEEGISLRSFLKTFIKVIFCLRNWILFFAYGFLPEAINVWDTRTLKFSFRDDVFFKLLNFNSFQRTFFFFKESPYLVLESERHEPHCKPWADQLLPRMSYIIESLTVLVL